MVDVWICHRYFLGCSMVLSFIFGCILFSIGMQRSTLDVLPLAVTKRHWVEAISGIFPDNESVDLSRGAGVSRIQFDRTPALMWPAIPTLLDRYGDNPYAWPSQIPAMLILLGVASMVVSQVGAYTAYNAAPRYIILSTSLMMAMIFSQFFFMFTFIKEDSSEHEDLKNNLRDKVYSDYEIGAKASNHFTYTLNSVMVSLECCGVTGPADFMKKNYSFSWSYVNSDMGLKKTKNRTSVGEEDVDGLIEGGESEGIWWDWSFNSSKGELFWKKLNKEAQKGWHGQDEHTVEDTMTGKETKQDQVFHRNVLFPLACCKNEIHMKGFEATLDCAASGDITLINNQGCRSMILEYFYATHGEPMIQTFLYILLFELIQLVMITILASIPKDFESEAAKLAIEYAETIELQAQKTLEEAEEENREVMAAVDEAVKRYSTESTSVSDTLPRRYGTTTATTTSLGTGTTVAGIIRRHVFVPFAKISSIPTPIGRRHSTEIW